MRAIKVATGLALAFVIALATPSFVAGESEELPEVLIMPSAIGDVEFPHEMHMNDLEIECDECHHYTKAFELDMPHDNYFDDFWIDCMICHVPGAGPKTEQACSGCHRRNLTEISDETQSAKVVIHMNCWSCHEIGRGAEASAACKDCHVR